MAKKVSYCAILVALALVFSYVEVLVPINLGIPGIKLGIANLVTVIGLYLLKPREVLLIAVIRILLAGFMFGSGMSILYSLAGGILSFAVMALLTHLKGFSIIGVSVAGGVAHNVGQALMAMCVVQTTSIMYYVPVLLIAGVITGAVIGILSGRILAAVKHEGKKMLSKE
jgi:heptaprenyl diphosphate synthase